MRKRNTKSSRLESVKPLPADPAPTCVPAQADGKLPSIFRKAVKYDPYDDRETINIEPHEICPATLSLLFGTNSKNRGENIDPTLLQEQADILKCVTNPFTGEPIAESIYTTALDHVAGFDNVPLINPDNPYNTTDHLRKSAVDAAFRNYAINGINTVIRDANNIFYTALAHKIADAGLRTKVVLTTDMYGMTPFVLEYNSDNDELIGHPVFSSTLFTRYSFGTILTDSRPDTEYSRYRNEVTNRVVDPNNTNAAIPGNLIDLRTYEECKDFWALVISILPIFEMNYNAVVQAMSVNKYALPHQELVSIFLKAYAEVQPVVVSAMENLVYVLWCESEIYASGKYGGAKPTSYGDLMF